jgi:hypothetical protein
MIQENEKDNMELSYESFKESEEIEYSADVLIGM